MADEHFSPETVQRFFRSQLDRDQMRGFVRHLLRQCPQCRQVLATVAQGQEFLSVIRTLEDGACRADARPRLRPPALRLVGRGPVGLR